MTAPLSPALEAALAGLDPSLPVRDQVRGLLRRALLRADAEHVRSEQLHPGISSLGTCRRQAFYGLTATPIDLAYEPQPKPAAWLGTWAHAGLLPLLRSELRPARIEYPVTWQPELEHDPGTLPDAEVPRERCAWYDGAGCSCRLSEAWPQLALGDPQLPAIPGSADLYRRRSKLVVDLKTVSPYQLDKARREGARPADLRKTHGYASALRQMGRPVDWVALLYVGTATSLLEQDTTGHLHLQPFDAGVEAANVEWWADVSEAAAVAGAHGFAEGERIAPRDEDGPGLSIICDGCRWLRTCWGWDAEPGEVGPQAVHTDPERAAAAAEYDQAKVDASEAEQRKKAARAKLTGSEQGVYVDDDGARWTLSWGKGASRLDQARAIELLSEAGLPVPYNRSSPPISVRPAPVEDQ